MPRRSQHQEDIKIGKKLVERMAFHGKRRIRIRYPRVYREDVPLGGIIPEIIPEFTFRDDIKDGWGDEELVVIDRTKIEVYEPKIINQGYIPESWEELVD